MLGEVCVPSPDLDDPTTPTTSGATKTPPSDCSRIEAPGHQGGKNTGGIDPALRVLYCSNVDISLDYEDIFLLLGRYGNVEKIRLRLASQNNMYECYVVFSSSASAAEARNNLNGHLLNDYRLRASLFNIANFESDPYDFVPHTPEESLENHEPLRKPPALIWHVASYKDGKDNFIRASECIQQKVGKIPQENMKRYGRNILIRAGNNAQAMLLSRFKAPDKGNIKAVTPHKTFNTPRGIIYSQDLTSLRKRFCNDVQQMFIRLGSLKAIIILLC